MKYLASIVAGLFIVLGMFVPPTVRSQSEPPAYFHRYEQAHPLNTKLQTLAKAHYTISFFQDFIFTHESGWSTSSINASSGACGLGQAWPCSKMPCGLTQADFDCQMKFFSDYTYARYGSWEAAYNYWIAHKNW